MLSIMSLEQGKFLAELPEELPDHIWIDATLDEIDKLAEIYKLHELSVEDVKKPGQMSKVEDFNDHLFIIAYAWQNNQPRKISFFLGDDFVISVHSTELKLDNWLDTELRHIKNPAGAVYWLLDRSIDSFFAPLDAVGETIEHLENRILQTPDKSVLADLFQLRRKLAGIRRIMVMQNAMLREVMSLEALGGNDKLHHYFADIYEHAARLLGNMDNNREVLNTAIEIYLSVSANKTNDVMRFLTVITTVFMPLTFIVGVYGMNFHYIPELSWHYGYFIILGIMALLSIVMLIYFRRKGWL